MEKYKEKVYFIGAGPGDPELITIKGHIRRMTWARTGRARVMDVAAVMGRA